LLLPLHDENPLRHIRFGYATLALIAACAATFAYQMLLPANEAVRFVYAYGTIPAVLFGERSLPPEIAPVPAGATLLTGMFLHGSLVHLAGNMLFLWVLGDNVEDALGHLRFVAFYALSGVAAALSHAAIDPASTVPMIGASGAISGVIGAYLVLHPHAPIRTLVFRYIVSLPAWVVLGLWILFQLANAAASGPSEAGIAWWAHIGGFVAGVVLIVPMRRRGVPLFGRPRR
jgi:membrane associated rhomboid family serine protease